MTGRYGGCFEEGIWWVYDTGKKCAVLERLAMVEGRKLRIIHGLNISHKELIYLLKKSRGYQNKSGQRSTKKIKEAKEAQIKKQKRPKKGEGPNKK